MKKINYNHPNYNEIRREAENLVNRDFNFIQLDVVKKVFDDSEFENITDPSFESQANYAFENGNLDKEELLKEYQEENDTEEEDGFYEWLEDSNYSDKISDAWQDRENYPMWNTLFEARDSYTSEWIGDNVDLLDEIGFGVMSGGDYFNNMIFVRGAGYDFYEAHWIPFFQNLYQWFNELTEKQA